MLSGCDSRSFSAWRLFAALGLVAVVSIGAYADNGKNTATDGARLVPFKAASALQDLTLSSSATLTTTQGLGAEQTAALQGTTRRASGGAACIDYQIDDGSTETSVGFNADAVTVWANRFTVVAGLETINAVSTAFGSVLGGNEDLVGNPFSVGVWSDPNQDGDPSDGALLSWATSVVGAGIPDTDTFQTVAIAPVTLAVGDFYFAVAWIQGLSFPAPLDQSEAGAGRSWVNGNAGAVFDPDAIEDGGWTDEDTVAEGIWLLRACTTGGPECGNGIREGVEECDGDDDAACPGECQVDCTCLVFGACCEPGGKVGGCDPDQTQAECEGQPGGGNWLGDGSTCLDCVCENATMSCLEDHFEPGCSDTECCSIVCAIDPFCCEVEWEFGCVGIALKSCEDTCGNGFCGSAETCSGCPADCGICGGCPASNCCGGFISQSVDPDLGTGGVSCGLAGTGSTPNGYARCFMPEEQGWTLAGDGSVTIIVDSVDVGFETSPAGGPLPFFVNVYLDLNGCPASGFGTGNAVLVGTAGSELPPGGEGELINVSFDTLVPLTVEIPANAGLIVEFEFLIDSSDPLVEPDIGFFSVFPGANGSGQCGPSFIRASQCGLVDWVDLATIGNPPFINSHTVILVNAIVTDPEAECTFCAICGDGDCTGGEVCFDPEAEEGCQLDCGVCPFCGDNNCDDDENCELCEADCSACDDCGYACDSDLNQSADSATSGGQVACGNGADLGHTTENAWARCFDLSENGLVDDVEVNSVTFIVEQLDDGAAGGPVDDIDIKVNLYLDADGCPASGFGTTAVLVDTQTISVSVADIGNSVTVNFPGSPSFAAGSALIVEVENPLDGTDPLFLHAFRAGANDGGQCRPNYLRTVSCGNADWTDMATIGDPPFIDTHLVMSVSMSCVDGGDPCGDCPTDVNDNNDTGPFDLATLLGAWGPTGAGNCLDANDDLNIGPFDLATLLGAWGPCP